MTRQPSLLKCVLNNVFFLIQVAIPLGLWLLEQLTYKKAGVNHHLRFKKTYIMRHYLTQEILWILGGAIVLITMILLWKLWVKHAHKKTLGIFPLVWTIAILALIVMPQLLALRAYPYIILGIVIAWSVSLINCVIQLS